MKFSDRWNNITVHIWLITSSFGIIYALLSFMEDLNLLNNIRYNHPWIKGLISIFVGLFFYFVIGLPHLERLLFKGLNN